jgi:DNA repair protein RecO (recombination protein O)
MLVKTKGIVLNNIRFKETSLIVKIYTEDYGLQSFLVNGVRTRKPKFGPALFQPLTILDMILWYKENQALKRLSELKCPFPFNSLTTDFRKITIGIFISEVLARCLKEETRDEPLFEFLISVLTKLDTEPVSPDFHLVFLFQLSHFLGFGPSEAEDIKASIRINEIFPYLGQASLTDRLEINNSRRRELLDDLLRFYSIHVEGFKELKSVRILAEIVREG